MAEPSRYKVGGDEANIHNNKLGITDTKTLEDSEILLLSDAYEYFFEKLQKNKLEFNLDLLFHIHRFFLEKLYWWAGKIRTVEISKGGILFAPSAYIKKSLTEFKKTLKENLPGPSETRKSIAKKLSIIHCEFNAIHPFREGNGRTIRLFLELMAVQAGFNIIDLGGVKNEAYIAACIAGMKKDYSKMEQIFYDALSKK